MTSKRDQSRVSSLGARPVLVAWLAGLVAGFLLVGGANSSTSASPTNIDAVVAPHFVALAEAATVRVSSRSCDGQVIGSGFGVALAEPDSSDPAHVLITNAHVTNRAAEIKVDQTVAPIVTPVLRSDPKIDLATAAPVDSVVLELSRRVPEAEERIVVVGHPGGGQVTYLNTRVLLVSDGKEWGRSSRVLLFEADLTGGYSGGPVVDSSGQVVGVVSGYEPDLEIGVAVLAVDALEWINQEIPQKQDFPAQVAFACADYGLRSTNDSGSRGSEPN